MICHFREISVNYFICITLYFAEPVILFIFLTLLVLFTKGKTRVRKIRMQLKQVIAPSGEILNQKVYIPINHCAGVMSNSELFVPFPPIFTFEVIWMVFKFFIDISQICSIASLKVWNKMKTKMNFSQEKQEITRILPS